MIHTNNPIIKHKAGLLNLAEELGNISRELLSNVVYGILKRRPVFDRQFV